MCHSAAVYIIIYKLDVKWNVLIDVLNIKSAFLFIKTQRFDLFVCPFVHLFDWATGSRSYIFCAIWAILYLETFLII